MFKNNCYAISVTQWSISFILKSFYQIPLTWSKIYLESTERKNRNPNFQEGVNPKVLNRGPRHRENLHWMWMYHLPYWNPSSLKSFKTIWFSRWQLLMTGCFDEFWLKFTLLYHRFRSNNLSCMTRRLHEFFDSIYLHNYNYYIDR